MLNNKLIGKIRNFDEGNIKAINPKTIVKLKEVVIDDEKFEKSKVFGVSSAAGNMSLWVKAVVLTYDALLVVEPKRKELAGAMQSLAAAEALLAEKQAALK
jgi:dynein heavy chain